MKIYNENSKQSEVKTNPILYIAFYFLFLFSYHLSYGQGSITDLKLLDEITRGPIVGAHFTYGSQRGISDERGDISIRFDPSLVLFISHLEYGSQKLSPGDVEDILKSGMILMKSGAARILQPVSVFAMRRSASDGVKLSLSDYDRLSHDAGAYLTQTPDIAVIQKGGNYGFDPVMRGFKYEQLNLVIDGSQSAMAACPNRMDPPVSQISLNQMDKVEILKGPYFLRYGTALGGTINFITPDPRFNEKFDPIGRLSSSYESNGNIFRTEGVVGLRDPNLLFGINGSWSHGDDYKDGNGIFIPSKFSRGSLGTNLSYRLPGKQYVTINLTRNFARDVLFASLPMDLRKDDTWLVNAKHQISFNHSKLKQWSTTAYLTYVSHLMDNLKKELDPRTVNAITDATTRTFGARTEGILEYPMTKVYLGADFRTEEAQGIRTREMLSGPMSGRTFEDNVWQNGRIRKTGVFAEYQHNFHPVELVFSGRLELNDAKLRETASEFTDVYTDTQSLQLNPSFSFGAQSQLNNVFSLAFWLGRSQRSGSLTERYINYFPVGLDPYELLGNPQINPEVNNQADINLVFEKAKTTFQLDIFSAYLQDYISSRIRNDLDSRLPASPGVRQFINIDHALMTGFEISWKQYLPDHLDLLVAMAYTYGKDLDHDEPLPEIAPLDMRIGLSGHFIRNALRPEIVLRHVIKQEQVAESYGETVTPGFSTFDLKLTYDISRILHIAGGVRNLFDVAYYEHLSRSVRDASERPIYAPGRNLFLTFSLDLTK